MEEDNVIELKENEGLTTIILNGEKVKKLLEYNVSKKELDKLEVTIKFIASSKKSSTDIKN